MQVDFFCRYVNSDTQDRDKFTYSNFTEEKKITFMLHSLLVPHFDFSVYILKDGCILGHIIFVVSGA